MWQNSKTQSLTKLKYDKTKNVQELKMWQLKNSKCDKTQKPIMGQNSEAQTVTRLENPNVTKLKKNQNLTKLKKKS